MSCVDTFKLSLGGDLLCLREETNALQDKFGHFDYSGYVAGLAPLLSGSDFAIANLETPIAPSLPLTDYSIRFNSPLEFLKSLKAIGFDFLSTANNHCLDRGIAGLNETIRQLDALGIAHDGTFLTQEDSERVYIAEIGGRLKVAIICCTFGTNSQVNGEMLPTGEEWRVALTKRQAKFRKLPVATDLSNGNFRTYIADETSPAAIDNSANTVSLEQILDKVRRAKGLADLVVVMPHVGGQYNPGPATYAKWVVDQFRVAGADLIIAGHSHTPHRMEWVGDTLVAYSLGNLCFTPGVGFYVPNVLSEYGVVLHVYVGVESKKVERVTFDVVKNIVDEDGCAHTVPVTELYANEKNCAQRDRLAMEVECVVNRVRGTGGNVAIAREYELAK